MKRMKKLFAILMTMAMVMGLGITGFAAATPVKGKTSNITISGLSSGVSTKVYVYRFASLQYDEEKNEYSWKIESWANPFIELNAGKTAYEIKKGEENNLKLAAQAHGTADPKNEDVTETSVTFNNVEIGGFVIICQDAEGANAATYEPLFVANTYDRDASPDGNGEPVAVDVTAYAKSEDRKVDKTQNDDFQQIGETVTYTVKATFPMSKVDEETLSEFKIYDKPTGLKIDADTVKVQIENASSDDIQKVTSSVGSDGKLTVDFAQLIGKNYDGRLITITYDAVVTNTEYNNKAWTSLPEETYKPGETKGDNGSIQITKKDNKSTTILYGAEFQVYDLGNGTWDPENPGTPMKLFYDETEGAYRPALDTDPSSDVTTTVKTNETDADSEDGMFKIVGLDEGKYHFVETKAPSGYSINTDGLDVEVTKGVTKTVTADFMDTKLSSLPETGGMGTTIFTIAGCVIMISAAGLFFASRRKAN